MLIKQNDHVYAFSLIELIITIVILSIVATLTVTSYMSYLLRTDVNIMYTTATSAQFALTNDYYNQGHFTAYASGANAFTTTASNFITSISTDSCGTITVTGNSANLQGNNIVLTLKATSVDLQNQIIWTCCVSDPSFFTYAPPECNNATTACSGHISATGCP